MKDFDIEWEPYSLPNILIYHAQLPEYIMDRLWTYIDNADTNKVWNQHLAGNLESSLTLDDTDDFFADVLVLPVDFFVGAFFPRLTIFLTFLSCS